ncbi:MAG: DNA topoisomerase VI subunit B [Planctomycetes bacterium]|nr:DNA topoisomerase VI subunit B [Planctomycetota bacterium]
MSSRARSGVQRVAAPARAPKRNENRAATAHEMSARQRDISVAEFFQKNRHLLGFDNPRKALLTTIKEAVDNSLDACEEGGILPDITVKVEVAPNGDGAMPVSPAQAERFVITVEDNGPGIVKKNIGKVFAKLLYGSKFHRLRMSRGQQGIGISAAGMYGQLTTGKPTKVISKIDKEDVAHCFEVSIDTKKNEPVEHETKTIKWDREHGTSVAISLEGRYQRGKGSIDEYLELTSIANPHARFVYYAPDGAPREFPRGVDRLPDPPREIKPHPYGIELGMLLRMLQDTKSHWLSGFLSTEFVRVSNKSAEEICANAKLSPRKRPRDIVGKDAEALYKSLQTTKLMSPPTDCLSPMTEDAIKAGLLKSIRADFYHAVTRPPKVYRGNPFQIEVGIAYGKGDGQAARDPAELAAEAMEKAENGEIEALAEGEDKEDEAELARVIRFANRVPLIYQQSACATYKAVLKTAWKNYGLGQSRGAPPQGPMTVFVHMASVWVPFTSEAKEAIAEYDEIVEEIKRALQECGRKLGIWLRKRQHAKNEFERRNTFQRYIEEVAEACRRIKGGKLDAERLKKLLQKIAEEVTGGEETDKLLNKKRSKEDDELAGIVELTPEGLKGAVPQMSAGALDIPLAVAPGAEPAAEAPPETAPRTKALPRGKLGKTPKAETGELIAGATKKDKRPKVDLGDVKIFSHGKQIAGKKAKGKAVSEPSLFDQPIEKPAGKAAAKGKAKPAPKGSTPKRK